jgi:hypothetical protein
MKYRLRKEVEPGGQTRWIVERRSMWLWFYCSSSPTQTGGRLLLDQYRCPEDYGLILRNYDLLKSSEVIIK